MSTTTILRDEPLFFQPGQLNPTTVLADYYTQLADVTQQHIDKLAGLYERQEISLTNYRELDWYLCAQVDAYGVFLAAIGHPQPQRPR